MNILVMGFQQESNAFCPVPTRMADYGRTEGEAIISSQKGKKSMIAGVLDTLFAAGDVTVIPGLAMHAHPYGTVEHEVPDYFIARFREIVAAAPKLDACCLVLHGATQSDASQDVCGDIVVTARELLGPDAVITVSCDLHADVTERILENADIICGYQTYPHLDIYETGKRAAALGLRMLKGEKFHTAAIRIPMIQPASGYSTAREPLKSIVDSLHAQVASGALEDFSPFQMQPWLDVACGGSTLLAISKDEAAAVKAVKEAAPQLWAIRHEMSPSFQTMEEIVAKAYASEDKKPIILSDFSDSVNGGAAGDNFSLGAYVLENAPDLRAATLVVDPDLVAEAFAAGVGAELDTTIGGKLDTKRLTPYPVKALVRSLHDGRFLLEGPANRLGVSNVGRVAMLSIGNLDVVVCTTLTACGDPQLLRHFGVEPTLYQLVIIKANTSFRAPYSAFAGEMCLIDTGCACTSDLANLPFVNLPRSFYPFSDEAAPAALEQVKVY